jgi:hypothetical protein
VVALGADHLLEVGSQLQDGEQGEVVIAVDLDVEPAVRGEGGVCGRLGERAP